MLKNFIFKVLELSLYRVFQVIFGYDRWHNYAYHRRQYAIDIVNFSNNLENPKSVLELGCGTGDIIRRINIAKRQAGDIDKKALAALKFFQYLSKIEGNVRTFYYECGNTHIDGKFDLIIMCNWLHNISHEVLDIEFNILINQHLEPNGYLIFDTVNNENYRYNHEIQDFTAFTNKKYHVLNQYENGRIVYFVRN